MSTAPVSARPADYTQSQNAANLESIQASRSGLSQEDFLSLLAVQFQQQDPLNPTSDTDFMAQMAQFNSLEQMRELNREFAQFRASADFATASGVIGKEVIVESPDGGYLSGQVESIVKTKGAYSLVIEGVAYPLSAVQSVQAPTPPRAPTE